jgi:Family of unknown function (DUF6090)
MQEEVTKHTKKIYRTVKDPKHTFGEKIKEVIAEIFIIVFAVTLSIWLHSWTEHRHQQKEVTEFLTDMKEDLKSDAESISKSKTELDINLNNYKFVSGLTATEMDSIKKVDLSANISTTKINNGNYEGFKSSGKIGYIEDKKLKKLILKYYHELTPGLLENENYNALSFSKVLDFINEQSGVQFDKALLMPKFKQLLKSHIRQSGSLHEEYNQTMKAANEIMSEIDKASK